MCPDAGRPSDVAEFAAERKLGPIMQATLKDETVRTWCAIWAIEWVLLQKECRPRTKLKCLNRDGYRVIHPNFLAWGELRDSRGIR